MNQPTIRIAGRPIGAAHPPYVIAEMSGNHNGRIERAVQLLQAARRAGADAVKLQTYTADTITIDHDSDDFRITGGPWNGRTLYDLYQEAHTPWDWHRPLFDAARELGLTIFSSPFDETAVELLESLGAPAYKIASFEAVDLPLIECVAATGKPLIISTGIADVDEIGEAVEAARGAGCRELVLLHCVSAYPAPAEDSNLLTLPDLARRFDVVAGLSDHTLGTAVAVAAVALGAALIEKHFTLRRADGGPDAGFSLEPDELTRLCEDTRSAWAALGAVSYARKPSEQANAQFRRSVYAVADIAAGELLGPHNVRRIRPGHGLPPRDYAALMGRRARVAIARGTPLRWDLVSDE